ncbi:hypothetical protein [Actinomadura parmotrematis]|uniref:Uncharacterized protein n=1 Tax=Actinomadura parmotrematis TaxID=2864039 RepID=A0ABS7FQI0_9ACTN|nr:hypothetical protein [Actinomadura parmotrematis]MBW8482631.1 hypothetical protein [Actinomadura parmotrematis]
MLAPDPADAVHAAGGYLFDRVMAGWDVTVLVAGGADPRPLRILGARTVDLDAALDAPVRSPWPDAVALGAALYETDARVRELVDRAAGDGRAEVRMWGGPAPGGADGAEDRDGALRHRLSVAARAFKAEALQAASASGRRDEAVETFRAGAPFRPPRLV